MEEETIQECPICIEDHVNTIVTDSCPNEEFPRKDLDEHGANCSYDPQYSRFCGHVGLKCDYRLNPSATVKAIEHFQKCHAALVSEGANAAVEVIGFRSVAENILKKSGTSALDYSTSEHDRGNYSMCNVFVLDLDSDFQRGNNGPTFLILSRIHPEKKTFSCTTFFMHENRNSLPEFQVEYTLINQTNVNKMKDLRWTMPVEKVPDSNNGSSVHFDITPSLSVTHLLKYYTRNDGSLQIKVSVSRQVYVDDDDDFTTASSAVGVQGSNSSETEISSESGAETVQGLYPQGGGTEFVFPPSSSHGALFPEPLSSSAPQDQPGSTYTVTVVEVSGAPGGSVTRRFQMHVPPQGRIIITPEPINMAQEQINRANQPIELNWAFVLVNRTFIGGA